jgi:hypothetical protein
MVSGKGCISDSRQGDSQNAWDARDALSCRSSLLPQTNADFESLSIAECFGYFCIRAGRDDALRIMPPIWSPEKQVKRPAANGLSVALTLVAGDQATAAWLRRRRQASEPPKAITLGSSSSEVLRRLFPQLKTIWIGSA